MTTISRIVAAALQPGKQKTKRVLLDELKVCGRTKDLQRGRQIHAEATESGVESCIYIANSLVYMYAKCGSMLESRSVFDSMKDPTTVSWNALMMGYAENGNSKTALELFAQMALQGCAPDAFTFGAAVKACTLLALAEDGCLERGRQIHLEAGCHLDMYVQSSLIDMYAKCGSMADAQKVYESMNQPDVVSWNALILGYADNGDGATALDLFARTKSQGFVADSVTLVAALRACTGLALEQGESGRTECLNRGRQIHSMVTCDSGLHVHNTLIDMYSKCGSMVEARQVFQNVRHPDVVSWNALLLGYVWNGEGFIALDFFAKMKGEGCAPNSITFVAALKACTCLSEQDQTGSAECKERVAQIHSEIDCSSDMNLINTLMDVYANCGFMVEAQKVFDQMKEPNVVSWNVLILGYAENGEGVTALDIFARMRCCGCTPNLRTYFAALKACNILGALESGMAIHADIGSRTQLSVTVVTCLVEFYAKCGTLVEAKKIFDTYSNTRDLKTWNALLAGYSRFGDTKSVLQLFEAMQEAGVEPDGITLLCILTCCSHAGLVQMGKEFFEAMATKYRLTPAVEHYNCIIDILGRTNKLDDSMALLMSMPCTANAVTWRTVLGVCCKWRNLGLGRLAFTSLVSLDDTQGVAYVLMGQIYGSKGMWEEQEVVLGMKREMLSKLTTGTRKCCGEPML